MKTDKELWLPIKGYEGRYEISNHGRVKGVQRYFVRNGIKVHLKEQILKMSLNTRGYVEYSLCSGGIREKWTAHRLVAIHFIENPLNLPHVNHIDGDKTNPNVENLEWCTHKQNMHHAIRTGLIKRKSDQYDKVRCKIINTKTGEVFNSLRELCNKNKNLKYNTIRSYLCGIRTNKSVYQYKQKIKDLC